GCLFALELKRRLRQRDARLQFGEGDVVERADRISLRVLKTERLPQLRSRNVRRQGVKMTVRRETEVSRENADDLVRFAAENNRLPDHVRIGAKPPSPERVV